MATSFDYVREVRLTIGEHSLEVRVPAPRNRLTRFSVPLHLKLLEPEIDPAALEAFAAGAKERRVAEGELPPWERFDPSDKPRYNVAIRLNDYQLAMLRYLAEARDTSQHKLLQRHLIPILKQLALEEFELSRSKSS